MRAIAWMFNKEKINMDKRTAAPALSSAGIIWLKLSVVYLVIGVAMGIAMGASENFTLRPVHAHVNLLGFAMLALAGLIYSVFPQAGQSRLASVHFWLQNLALPVMMAALALLLLGHREVIPVLVAGELVTALAVMIFAVNVFKNAKAS